MARRDEGVAAARSLVGFEVGPVLYAIDIHRVREIIRPLATLPLPQMPASVLGVADHRGAVVPVVDLRTRFGLSAPDNPRSQRWIVVSRAGAELVALVVDRVSEVFGGASVEPRAAPSLGGAEPVRGLTAVYAHNGRLAFVVDPDLLAEASLDLDLDIDAARALLTQGMTT